YTREGEPPANRPAPLKMKQHLAVSAIGSDRTGMVHELTRIISESGGNISESRMASLGTEFAMLLLVSGNWHALAKLETELKRLAETSNLSIHLKRTEPRAARTDMLPYSIDVVCLDRSEEHTSELQSRFDLVCRLLLEKKKQL